MKPVTTKDFFSFIFGNLEGYLCIATIDRTLGKKFNQAFFQYPDDLNEAMIFIDKNKMKRDTYFCPHLFIEEGVGKERKKDKVAEAPVAWSDGDECPIESLLLKPSSVIRTSEGRHAFFWKFDGVLPPEDAEEISKRIAYYHADEGMDKSGWDLTQLLRVPDTYNHKYNPPHQVRPAVIDEGTRYLASDFEDYPEVKDSSDIVPLDMGTLPKESAEEILKKYQNMLNPKAFELFSYIPTQDWSKHLWELELTLLEGGLTLEEAFVVANDANCNKYKRDGRPSDFMWKEIQRAYAYVQQRKEAPPSDGEPTFTLEPVDLLTDAERIEVKNDITFIEEYSNWAKQLGDAAEQYHPAGAFTVLSSLLSGHVKLPTAIGTIVPNLWFMILADTTLTRKSTAMDNATDLLLDVDYDALLATDGSVEGLLTALGTRPNRSSLFYRDEITGLVESMAKKEYMAGMMETLTKLYDGKHMKRILRKEVIDVKEPILVILSGGIRNKMMELVEDKHITSGFLPRFIFVTAESDMTRFKPLGPPTDTTTTGREKLLDQLTTMHQHYVVPTVNPAGTKVHIPKQWAVELTPDAWQRYNRYESKMLEFALNSHDPTMLTPMMDRLAKSGLKCTVLIAASRIHEDKVVATERDIMHAFSYIEQWMRHTLYIISNMGKTHDERKLQKIMGQIESQPGVHRSKLMQRNYLTKREADNIFSTLEERNAIKRDNRGSKGERVFPVG